MPGKPHREQGRRARPERFVFAWIWRGVTRLRTPLEAVSNGRPREMVTQTQNPAYRMTSPLFYESY